MRKQRDSGLIGAAIEGLHVRREGYYYRHPTGAEVLAYPRANKLEFHVPVGVAQQGLKLRERLLEIYGHQGKYESMDDDPMLKILLDEDYEDDGETTIPSVTGHTRIEEVSEMSIVRFSSDSDVYIYPTSGGRYGLHYRAAGTSTKVMMELSGKWELRATVQKLVGKGLKAPADLLDRIDAHEHFDGR